jgi:hypothetical protein
VRSLWSGRKFFLNSKKSCRVLMIVSWKTTGSGGHQVFARLRQEFHDAGRQTAFNLLKGYLTGEATALSYHEVASDLGMTEAAVKVAVHRLRRRYRELVREEITQTVAGPEQVEEELRQLFAAIRT